MVVSLCLIVRGAECVCRLDVGCVLRLLWECAFCVSRFDIMENCWCAVVGQEALQRDFEEARGTFPEEF